MRNIQKNRHQGFTLIEVLIVMAVTITLVAGFTYTFARRGKDKAYLTRSESEMIMIGNAIKLKVQAENVYPGDVSRALPAGIEQYIATPNKTWPNAPWPGSVYDYENWDGGEVVQISARFCRVGEDAICKANAEKYLKNTVSSTVLANWDSYSSVYYCIKENLSSATQRCRSHESKPVTHPGYRVDISTVK